MSETQGRYETFDRYFSTEGLREPNDARRAYISIVKFIYEPLKQGINDLLSRSETVNGSLDDINLFLAEISTFIVESNKRFLDRELDECKNLHEMDASHVQTVVGNLYSSEMGSLLRLQKDFKLRAQSMQLDEGGWIQAETRDGVSEVFNTQ